MSEHKPTGKREEISPHETRYIRRDEQGHVTEDQVDKGASLKRDRETKAKHEAPKGQGDRGDQRRD